VDNIEIRNWKGFEPAVEAGYRAANEVLDKLTHPVIDLRRRVALADLPPVPTRTLISAAGG
jgi:NTE family protein